MGITVLRRSTFRTVPWKNGGGVTHEALRVPETGEVFDWRVSLAEIDRPGPFSSFSGYQRHMALVNGKGVRLAFGDGKRVELNRPGDLVHFDGSLPVECTLIEGPCLDFNLIASSRLDVSAWVGSVPSGAESNVFQGTTRLLMPLAAQLEVQASGAQWLQLNPLDLAVLEGPGGLDFRPSDAQRSTPAPVFFATISHGCKS